MKNPQTLYQVPRYYIQPYSHGYRNSSLAFPSCPLRACGKHRPAVILFNLVRCHLFCWRTLNMPRVIFQDLVRRYIRNSEDAYYSRVGPFVQSASPKGRRVVPKHLYSIVLPTTSHSLSTHTHHIAESVLRTKACVSNSPTGEPWGCGGIGYGIGCCYILRVYVYGCDLDKQWMAKHWVVSTQTRDFRCLLTTSLQFEPNSELLSFYFNRFKLLVARWFLRPAIWACPVAAAWTVRVTDWFPCELLPCTNLECMASVFICIRRPCSSVTHSEYCCWITSLCQY